MNLDTINALEEALNASPGNDKLRMQIAQGLFNLGEYERAKGHTETITANRPGNQMAKRLLANCFGKLGNPAAGLVICEELLDLGFEAQTAKVYIQLLLADGQEAEAVQQYQKLMEEQDWTDEELEERLKVRRLTEDDEEDESHLFLESPDSDFSKVGGMDEVKNAIRIKIIQPLENPDLYKAFGKKAGGGILLYGPPGCGKTHLARATAGEIKSKFLSVGIEEVMEMWIGSSERNLHGMFDLARRSNPCVLFFDEIDALGSKRNDMKASAGRMVINQFLKELDGVDNDNEGVLILGATNCPWHMDSAFLRPGRFDRIIFVPPPDQAAREVIINILLQGKPAEDIDTARVAEKTPDFSGADLMAAVDSAVEQKLEESMKTGALQPLNTKDILRGVKKVRPSTKDWFKTARNYALYSNASGFYDEILDYLKL